LSGRWSGWRRGLAIRRTVAAALVLLAVVLALRPAAGPPVARVVIARADLAPGTVLGPVDVELRPVDTAVVPKGAVADVGAVLGRRPDGPVRTGEILTDVRLVGREAAIAAAGTADAAGVPVRLADAAVAVLLRPGAQIDVVGAGPASAPGDAGEPAIVLAERAVVLDVLPATERTGAGPVVLVALPGPVAARVAAATLGQEVTVTLR